jgi:hypothetical protein
VEKPRLKPELRRYHLEGWVHVTTYRVAIAYSIVIALITLLHLLNVISWAIVKILLIMYWFVLTPLFYSVVKGTLLALSKGVISSYLAETVLKMLRERYRFRYVSMLALFYILLILWVLGFIAFLLAG